MVFKHDLGLGNHLKNNNVHSTFNRMAVGSTHTGLTY